MREKERSTVAEQGESTVKRHTTLKAKVSLVCELSNRFKYIQKGDLFFGAIKEVSKLYLLVSLPFNLLGRVDLVEISDVLKEIVSKVSILIPFPFLERLYFFLHIVTPPWCDAIFTAVYLFL